MNDLREKIKVILTHLVTMPSALVEFERRTGITFNDASDVLDFSIPASFSPTAIQYIEAKYRDASSASEIAINP